MSREVFGKIVNLVLRAAELARTVGIHNILQPGLVKEMIMADILGHKVITSKRSADACDVNDPTVQYEYLTCKEGGSGQLDRMFKEPPEKRAESLNRIWRNRKVYLAVFFESNQTKIKIIYELKPDVVAAETERQLDRSRNDISHVGFPESWAKRMEWWCTRTMAAERSIPKSRLPRARTPSDHPTGAATSSNSC